MKAVIMAGGQGTRFWPLSRARRPKQFLHITGSRSLLQQTVDRLHQELSPEDLYVVCGSAHVQQVRAQLPELAADQVIVEPVPRGTAACIGLAALYLRLRHPSEVMAVLPADHLIEDVHLLHRALRAAESMAQQGWLVTFGIQPRFASTGYGYLQRGEAVGAFDGYPGYRVQSFAEKPDAEQAREFLKSGDYFWNSGIFVWSVETILREIRSCFPRLYEGLERLEQAWDDPLQMGRHFSSLPAMSIDYGVMEKSSRVAMLPCDPGWNDVGSWKAVGEVIPKDERGIASNTRVVNIDSRDVVVHSSEGKLVALLGIENLVYVETKDAVLICSRDRTEEVRRIVEQLESKQLDEFL